MRTGPHTGPHPQIVPLRPFPARRFSFGYVVPSEERSVRRHGRSPDVGSEPKETFRETPPSRGWRETGRHRRTGNGFGPPERPTEMRRHLPPPRPNRHTYPYGQGRKRRKAYRAAVFRTESAAHLPRQRDGAPCGQANRIDGHNPTCEDKRPRTSPPFPSAHIRTERTGRPHRIGRIRTDTAEPIQAVQTGHPPAERQKHEAVRSLHRSGVRLRFPTRRYRLPSCTPTGKPSDKFIARPRKLRGTGAPACGHRARSRSSAAAGGAFGQPRFGLLPKPSSGKRDETDVEPVHPVSKAPRRKNESGKRRDDFPVRDASRIFFLAVRPPVTRPVRTRSANRPPRPHRAARHRRRRRIRRAAPSFC